MDKGEKKKEENINHIRSEKMEYDFMKEISKTEINTKTKQN